LHRNRQDPDSNRIFFVFFRIHGLVPAFRSILEPAGAVLAPRGDVYRVMVATYPGSLDAVALVFSGAPLAGWLFLALESDKRDPQLRCQSPRVNGKALCRRTFGGVPARANPAVAHMRYHSCICTIQLWQQDANSVPKVRNHRGTNTLARSSVGSDCVRVRGAACHRNRPVTLPLVFFVCAIVFPAKQAGSSCFVRFLYFIPISKETRCRPVSYSRSF
jgi:hypothetical protein